MQTSYISNLINKFENQEFSNIKKKNVNNDNQIKKITLFNNVYDSAGTLYGEDEEKILNGSSFYSKEGEEYSQKNINDNNDKEGYISVREKLKFSDYKESAETLITQSKDNIFNSELSLNTPNYSLPQFDSEASFSGSIESSVFSLSNLEDINQIKNDNNEIENDDSIYSKETDENKNEENEVNDANGGNTEVKKFKLFDINKIINSIVRVNIVEDKQEEDETKNANIDNSNIIQNDINIEELYNDKDLDKEKTILEFINECNNNDIKIRVNETSKDKISSNSNTEEQEINYEHENNQKVAESVNNQDLENNYDYSKEPYKEKIIDRRFKLTYVLARGGCGEIRATEDIVTGEELVCKIIPRAKKPRNKHSKKYQYYLDYELDLLREATISSLLIHPNIIHMKYMVRTVNYFYLISEKIKGEDLCDYIIKKGRLSEKKAREIIYEVIVALQYLHNNYIIHRDVKCENIMREKGTGRIILLDFGSACFYTDFSSQINEFCGSPVYQAPEVILSQPYWGPELDIWGLGVVLYVLTTGRLPFDPSQPDMNDSSMVDLMYGGPEYPDYLSYECKMLLSRMLCFDPNQRAKIPDILKHPWMRSYVQYKKLKVYNFSNNNGGQDNLNTMKRFNRSDSSLSLKGPKFSIPKSIKNFKFSNLLMKTKKLITFDTSENVNKHYMNLQKEQLTLNSPYSVDSSALVDSIFNNNDTNQTISNRNGTKNVVSQMFAYAVSREDETKENRIKLLKKIMNNQMRIQRNIIESS